MRPYTVVIFGAILGAFAVAARALTPVSDRNIAAFLATIRHFESGNNYGAYVYGGQITNFSGHPIDTGEFDYKVRPDTGQRTSAAGAYQIVYSTWRDLGLPDFSRASQDSAAMMLIMRRGAGEYVAAGLIYDAIAACRDEWESFKTVPTDAIVSYYKSQGGEIARA